MLSSANVNLENKNCNDSNSLEGSNSDVLNWEQIKKLDQLLNNQQTIHGRGNFPTLIVRIKDLIRNLHKKLSKNGVAVSDVRINGGVASHILTDEGDYPYSDIDIIFGCSIGDSYTNFEIVKDAVLECLLDYFPSNIVKDKISTCHLKEAYVIKMVKVVDNDCWSLISLRNNDGQYIELKFVDKMKRQFQFSVDSFQIYLDSLLRYYDCHESKVKPNTDYIMNPNFYPTVVVLSVYGDIKKAIFHLHNKLIDTIRPEEIKGRGLLKYVSLLIKGYRSESTKHEKYMCSRFFIDYSDIHLQNHKIVTYLRTHFPNNYGICFDYLKQLYEIVNNSTVCLMNHERQLTLGLIQYYIESYRNLHYQYENTYMVTHYGMVAQSYSQNKEINNNCFKKKSHKYDINCEHLHLNVTEEKQPQRISAPSNSQQIIRPTSLSNKEYSLITYSLSPIHSPSPSSSSSTLLSTTSSNTSSPSPSPAPELQKNIQEQISLTTPIKTNDNFDVILQVAHQVPNNNMYQCKMPKSNPHIEVYYNLYSPPNCDEEAQT